MKKLHKVLTTLVFGCSVSALAAPVSYSQELFFVPPGNLNPQHEIRFNAPTDGGLLFTDSNTVFSTSAGYAFTVNEMFQAGGSVGLTLQENYKMFGLSGGPVANFNLEGERGLRTAFFAGAELGLQYISVSGTGDTHFGAKVFAGKRFPVTTSVTYAPVVEFSKYSDLKARFNIQFIAFQAHF
jgi:hypothetical protein